MVSNILKHNRFGGPTYFHRWCATCLGGRQEGRTGLALEGCHLLHRGIPLWLTVPLIKYEQLDTIVSRALYFTKLDTE